MEFIKIEGVRFKKVYQGNQVKTEMREKYEFYCRLSDIKSVETSTYRDTRWKITLNFIREICTQGMIREINHLYIDELPESLKELIRFTK